MGRNGILHSSRRLADLLPITLRGAGVALLAGLALWTYGYGSLDLVAFALGAGSLGLLALCALAVSLTGLLLARRPPPSARASTLARLEADSPIATGFALPALAGLPLVSLRWQWREPSGVECRPRLAGEQLLEEVVARRRALVPSLRRRFEVRDAFGLAAVAWERREPTPVAVLPAVRRLQRMPLLQSFAGADGLPHPAGRPEGDRMDIRRYAPGDPVRDILWKSFARTRQLNVRVRERSIERSRRTLAYLVASERDEAAAAAARVALESGALGGAWAFGADGTPGVQEDLADALRAIARSGCASTRCRDGAGLDAFLREVSGGAAESCVVFASAHSGPWLDGVLEVARRHAGKVSFVLGTDGGASAPAEAPWWRSWIFAELRDPGLDAGQLRELLGQLAREGHPALVVDRSTGRSFGQAAQGLSRLVA